MNASVYELLALAMRYWFIALMAAIVFLLAQSFLREWRIEKAVQRRIASAACTRCAWSPARTAAWRLGYTCPWRATCCWAAAAAATFG